MKKKKVKLPKPFQEFKEQDEYDAEAYLWNYDDEDDLTVEISLSGAVSGKRIQRFAKWVNQVAAYVKQREQR